MHFILAVPSNDSKLYKKKKKKSSIRWGAVNRCDSLGHCVHLETTVVALLQEERACFCLISMRTLPAAAEQIIQRCTRGTESEDSVSQKLMIQYLTWHVMVIVIYIPYQTCTYIGLHIG